MAIVEFKAGEDTAIASGLWQYDFGQVLRIRGLDLPEIVAVDFSTKESGADALRKEGIERDGMIEAEVPNGMLAMEKERKDYYIYAFVYVMDEEKGETVKKIYIPVKARPKPEYFKTLEEKNRFEKRMDEIEKSIPKKLSEFENDLYGYEELIPVLQIDRSMSTSGNMCSPNGWATEIPVDTFDFMTSPEDLYIDITYGEVKSQGTITKFTTTEKNGVSGFHFMVGFRVEDNPEELPPPFQVMVRNGFPQVGTDKAFISNTDLPDYMETPYEVIFYRKAIKKIPMEYLDLSDAEAICDEILGGDV